MSLHECRGYLPHDAYGDAITECVESGSPGLTQWNQQPGQFWVGNGEYGSQVNFCPYCGAKAPVQVETIIEP